MKLKRKGKKSLFIAAMTLNVAINGYKYDAPFTELKNCNN